MTKDTEGNPGFQPARWYLCAICQPCGQSIEVMEMVPTAPVSSAGATRFRGVSCSSCHKKGDYPLDRVLERLLANLGLPTETLH